MLYIRFPLSLRNVEDLLRERGIQISHETVHQPAAGCQPQRSSSGIGACVNSHETCQRTRARAVKDTPTMRGRHILVLGQRRVELACQDFDEHFGDPLKVPQRLLPPSGSMACESSPCLYRGFADQKRTAPGIQSVPARGTRAMAAASIVSATRSSGSRLWTWLLPQARAMVCASSVITLR
jgi:hypothetical protein